MNSKTRFIPLVAIGAILLSLFVIIPAFAEGTASFIDPDDIDGANTGTLTDPTPDDQEWARAGGEVGLMVEDDDDSDFPVRRVLIPELDAVHIGATQVDIDAADFDIRGDDVVGVVGKTSAHQPTIDLEGGLVAYDIVADDTTDPDTTYSLIGLAVNDYVMIGDETVRRVTAISQIATSTVTATTTIEVTVDRPYANGMDADAAVTVYKISQDAIDAYEASDGPNGDWSDDHTQFAMAVELDDDDVDTGLTSSLSEVDLTSRLADSGVATDIVFTGNTSEDVTRGAHRFVTRVDDLRNENDIIIMSVNDAGDAKTAYEVRDAQEGGRIILSASASLLEGQADGGTTSLYAIFWSDERNYAPVRIRSQRWQTDVTVVLRETGHRSGNFVLKIMADGTPDDVEPNVAPEDGIPTLPVNPRDVITLRHPDSTNTIPVESSGPTFSGLTPGHGTKGRENRPEVTAQVIDGDSGLDEDGKNIDVLFLIQEGTQTRTVTNNVEELGELDEIGGGFEITLRLRTDGARVDDDATIMWWVKATDNAGNVGYSDRQPTKDGADDTCEAGAEAVATALQDMKCQPFVITVDNTAPSLRRAEAGRHWNSALQTGDSDDKTEYRVSKSDETSILAVFDEPLDATTVSASDFEVNDANPIDADVHNVTVRKDSGEDADGKADIEGQDVLDIGESRGYVFLTVAAMTPNARPKVEIVGEVYDIAGNRRNTGKIDQASDRVAPSLSVTLAGGERPVTDDSVTITITSDEDIGTPTVMFYQITSTTDDDDNTTQELIATSTASATFKSAKEYTAKLSPDGGAGLYTVYVSAADASGGNEGTVGDKTADVDVDGETSAILFELDEAAPVLDVDPGTTGNQDEFSVDDPDAFITIGFSSEGNEYDAQENADDVRVGDDLDTHGMVTIVSATLDGTDISGSLASNSAGNVFLYKASGLALGDHKLAVIAKDEAGNENPTAQTATIMIIERKRFSLKLNPGWNLVSIPGEPRESAINTVIPADHPADTVLTYDPTVPGNWLTAQRGARRPIRRNADRHQRGTGVLDQDRYLPADQRRYPEAGSRHRRATADDLHRQGVEPGADPGRRRRLRSSREGSRR